MLSLWLPDFAIELALGELTGGELGKLEPAASGAPAERPLVLVEAEAGRPLLSALDRRAVEAGLAPGMALADSRALAPGLRVLERDRPAERRALEALADWLERYSPWVALDPVAEPAGAAGLLLEVTGCAHLFGGEAALAGDLLSRLGRIGGGGFRRRGHHGRLAVAGTPGAAWAAARYATGTAAPFRLVAPGRQAEILAGLPAAGLRLPDGQVELLARFGLLRIGQLAALPPETLTARAGPAVARRLRQAFGQLDEPVSPRRPVPAQRVRRVFGEPIAAAEDLARGLEGLLIGLCERLEAAGLGARRVELALHRVDGSVQRQGIGLSRASREADRLKRLFAQRLERLDPGFGVDALVVSAPETEPLDALQLALSSARAATRPKDPEDDLAALVDRLENRLGAGSVTRPAPRESHLPERATEPLAPFARPPRQAAAAWPRGLPRPPRLLARPEPIEVVAALPDSPPRQFRWRRLLHRVVRAEGPERVGAEWWLADPSSASEGARDYFRVEDEDGRRFWLYRSGPPEGPGGGRWFLQGLFG
ncbi:MAG: DNA polymerase Y family protein [Tistlia sp.]|uniref:DinB/UmuC family translesion DNA polymerase n=1 Tax=Tistlia sp. TaxID=3057121 RepID=UPI0034A5B5A2